MPSWIAGLLTAQGWANRDGVGRKIRVGICRRCKARVLRGLNADRAASPREIDPDALDTFGEAAAILAGRCTYSVWKVPGGYELHSRDPEHIRHTAADHSDQPILGDHQCKGAPG